MKFGVCNPLYISGNDQLLQHDTFFAKQLRNSALSSATFLSCESPSLLADNNNNFNNFVEINRKVKILPN